MSDRQPNADGLGSQLFEPIHNMTLCLVFSFNNRLTKRIVNGGLGFENFPPVARKFKHYLWFWLVVVGLPISAELDQTQLQNSSVLVTAWFGKRTESATGIVAKVDAYNGYVITSAATVRQADRVTVTSHSGAQLVGQVVQADGGTNLALIKVNGLDAASNIFAQSSASTGETIWAASKRDNQLAVIPGHVSSIQKEPINTFDLSLRASAAQSSAIVLNECGEALGFRSGQNKASIDSREMLEFLDGLNVRPEVSRVRCISAVQQVRQTANQANLAAEQARLEAVAAQEVAEKLTLQLAESDQRNQKLVAQAALAKQTAENAIQTANKAQLHAEQTRIELEKQTAALSAETEVMVQHLTQDRAEAELRFKETLEAQQRSSTQREDFLLAALVVLFGVVVVFLVVMQPRGFKPTAILTRVHPEAFPEPVPAAVAVEHVVPLEKAAPPASLEYLFEGKDEEGIRYLLRVSGTRLSGDEGVIIGREVTHMINHVDVSRKHAKISVKQDRLMLEDLGSTNGTSVNGETIDDKGPVTVSHGDEVIFGSVVMKLKVLAS